MVLGGISNRRHMTVPHGDVIADTWVSFERAANMGVRVTPAIPILFFGDLDAYRESPLRIVTVGLNPSQSEFPPHDPFCRFPLAADVGPSDQDRYLASCTISTLPCSHLQELVREFRSAPLRNKHQLLPHSGRYGAPHRHLLTGRYQPDLERPQQQGPPGSRNRRRTALAPSRQPTIGLHFKAPPPQTATIGNDHLDQLLANDKSPIRGRGPN